MRKIGHGLWRTWLSAFTAIFLVGCVSVNSHHGLSLDILQHAEQPQRLSLRTSGFQNDLFRQSGDTSEQNVDFFVEVKNRTPEIVLLPDAQFSSGYGNSSIKVMVDGEVFSLKRRPCAFTRNIENYVMVAPGSSILLPVSLDRRIWDGMPILQPGKEISVKFCLHEVDKLKDGKVVSYRNGLETDFIAIVFQGVKCFSPLSRNH